MTVQRLQQHMLDTIPLARAMALSMDGFADGLLRMRAPLAPNSNDKGCAFGGSLASLMTLAGWGVANLHLGAVGEDAEIYVQDSQIRYLAPVWEDIEITAGLAPGFDPRDFLAAYDRRGRARAAVDAQCRLRDGQVAATLSARFVAIDPARRQERLDQTG